MFVKKSKPRILVPKALNDIDKKNNNILNLNISNLKY
jgi:hypothetical protein